MNENECQGRISSATLRGNANTSRQEGSRRHSGKAAGPKSRSGSSQHHCLLCLQPQDHDTVLDVMIKNGKCVKFQPVLHYLTGIDPNLDTSTNEYSEKGVPIMDDLPTMCRLCFNAVARLYYLHGQLLEIQRLIQKQTEVVREIVKETNISPVRNGNAPRQRFYKNLATVMEKEQIAAIRKFVEELHDKILSQEGKAIIFPNKLPEKETVITAGSPPQDVSANPPDTSVSASDQGTLPIPVEVKEEVPCNPSSQSLEDSSEDYSESDMDLDLKYEGSDLSDDDAYFNDVISDDEDISDQEFKSVLEGYDDDENSIFSTSNFETMDEGDLENKRQYNCDIGTRRQEAASQICDLCFERISFNDILQHMESHVQNYVTKCANPSCRHLFSCPLKMEKHLKNPLNAKCRRAANLEGGEGVKKCDECGEEMRSGIRFRAHLTRHESDKIEKPFSCPIPGCAAVFSFKQSVQNHIAFHNLRSQAFQKCSKCEKIIEATDIVNHLTEFHQATDIISCKLCPFAFHERKPLIDHLHEYHRDENGICCDMCNDGIRYSKRSSLVLHYSKVHEITMNEVSFVCEYCSKECRTLSALLIHKKMKHPECGASVQSASQKYKRNHKCNLCEVTFSTDYSLTSHKIRAHGMNPLTCKYCNEKFDSAHVFYKHQRKHAGTLQTYNCPYEGCDKVYTGTTALNKHVLLNHSGPKVNKDICDICNKEFSHPDSLRMHKGTVHAETRQHLCDICGKGFTLPSYLKKHKLIHQNEEIDKDNNSSCDNV